MVVANTNIWIVWASLINLLSWNLPDCHYYIDLQCTTMLAVTLKAFSHWTLMRIECALYSITLNSLWENFHLNACSSELASIHLRRWFVQAQCALSYSVSWYHALLTLLLAMAGWNNGATRAFLSVWGEQNVQNQLDNVLHNQVVCGNFQNSC